VRILASDEARSWLKQRRNAAPAAQVVISWPSSSLALTSFTARLATLSGWRGSALVLERPGLPRDASLAELCALQAQHGVPSTPADIQLGNYPGYLFDDRGPINQALVSRLLRIMMTGLLEGHLVTKDGRFWMTIGCGIVEFRTATKSLTGAVRKLTRDMSGSPLSEHA